MKVSSMWKFHGNLNRISEMTEAGFGPNAISGIFRDNGIELSPNVVSSLIAAKEELTKKSLPKAAVKELISKNEVANFNLAST